MISSTGSGLRFAFDAAYDRAREEYVVGASRELYPDAELERQYLPTLIVEDGV